MFRYIQLIVSLLFYFNSLHAQVTDNLSFTSKKDSCETRYIIDKTGIYFTAVSCKQSSAVSFGKYTLYKNRIFFKPLSFDSLSPVDRIDESASANDTLTKITFLARHGKIIPDKDFAVDAIDTSGKYYKRFFLNQQGAVFINPRRYKLLRINYLNHFFAKWSYIQTKATDLTIELSLPPEFFHHHHPQIDMHPGFVLIVKPDGLYDVYGQLIDSVDK